jgi:hypothetical protein
VRISISIAGRWRKNGGKRTSISELKEDEEEKEESESYHHKERCGMP